MKWKAICSAILGFCLCGCNSISSTLVNRTEFDDLVGSSNGELKKHCTPRPFKGVPITMHVPTHVQVVVTEKVKVCFDGTNMVVLTTPNRHLSVDTEIIYTDRVFTVDLKRPAAGTADYSMKFGKQTDEYDNRQYFSELQSKVVDETIQDVTTAIETVLTGFPSSDGLRASEAGVQQGKMLYFDQLRTVAWKRFDIDSPDLEGQMQQYIAQYFPSSCDFNLPTAFPGLGTAEDTIGSTSPVKIAGSFDHNERGVQR